MRRWINGAAIVAYLGLGIFWLNGGTTKLWSGFDAAPFLKAAVAKAQAEPASVLPFMGRLVSAVALPAIAVVDILIPVIEIAVGLGFLLCLADKRFRQPTLALAGILSILFLACGANGWNPFLLGTVLFLALAEGTPRPERPSVGREMLVDI